MVLNSKTVKLLALINLMNTIERDQFFPEQFEVCNITSIWKSKGPKYRCESYKGVFCVSVFRNILDRLIYNDQYNNIDSRLTDANVGSRKSRNISYHIFVLNAVLNSIREQPDEAYDIQVYNVKETFDSLWFHEV